MTNTFRVRSALMAPAAGSLAFLQAASPAAAQTSGPPVITMTRTELNKPDANNWQAYNSDFTFQGSGNSQGSSNVTPVGGMNITSDGLTIEPDSNSPYGISYQWQSQFDNFGCVIGEFSISPFFDSNGPPDPVSQAQCSQFNSVTFTLNFVGNLDHVNLIAEQDPCNFDPSGLFSNIITINRNDKGKSEITINSSVNGVAFIAFVTDIFLDRDSPGQNISSGDGYNISNVRFNAPPGNACGDGRDAIIAEYNWATIRANRIAAGQSPGSVPLSPDKPWIQPTCDDFQTVATWSNPTYTFADFTNHTTKGCSSLPNALVRDPILIDSNVYGFKLWVQKIGSSLFPDFHKMTSGYRDPPCQQLQGTAAHPSALESRHEFGDAVDLKNNSRSVAEHDQLENAATAAGAGFVEPVTGPCRLKCVHADWRYYPGSYASPVSQ